MSNIRIDEEVVEELCQELNATNAGGFQDIISDYDNITRVVTKSAGDMLEAIKEQIVAEKQVVETMSKTCLQLVSSINVATQSLQNIDEVMATKMN